ncbi:MAG: 16S rRNA (guanine(966)-N(2))-methyltransferase RsmD [Acholeplasmatales bacterium]|nr:16S rRNA (guanine(966)-N(2))-methyltransferase RsmD [Acholeplasmatales bacterium]
MRINAGIYKRHNIYLTNLETTRETSDKVRQAIFNLIGQYFENITVLDLFAGSGAMGLEAISRGADKAYFNDLNKKACDVVKKNINLLKIEKPCTVLNANYSDALKRIHSNEIDIVFLDPPYAMTDTKKIMQEILDSKILKEKAIISFEMAKTTPTSECEGFTILKEKIYGIKKVVIYKLN